MIDSTEILQASAALVNPMTAEVIPLDARTDELARYIADVREAESRLREAKAIASREILARMDRLASWTLHFDGVDIEGESPAAGVEKHWDGEGLHEWLISLVDGGQLALEAVQAAVEIETVYRVRQAGVSALRKAGFRRVDEFCEAIPRERRVKKIKVTG